jgi:hypothetical protein
MVGWWWWLREEKEQEQNKSWSKFGKRHRPGFNSDYQMVMSVTTDQLVFLPVLLTNTVNKPQTTKPQLDIET